MVAQKMSGCSPRVSPHDPMPVLHQEHPEARGRDAGYSSATSLRLASVSPSM